CAGPNALQWRDRSARDRQLVRCAPGWEGKSEMLARYQPLRSMPNLASRTGQRGLDLPQQDRLNIAVFIDFDNIEIGVKSTLGQQFDVGAILDAIKERGEVVTKIAYADWTRAG